MKAAACPISVCGSSTRTRTTLYSCLSHPHGVRKALREITVPILLSNSPRGNSLLHPLHIFHISVYYHATSYKTWETPGGSHIFLLDDRFRQFHACICINTVLTENDSLFFKYVIEKALYLFIQFINHFREHIWQK